MNSLNSCFQMIAGILPRFLQHLLRKVMFLKKQTPANRDEQWRNFDALPISICDKFYSNLVMVTQYFLVLACFYTSFAHFNFCPYCHDMHFPTFAVWSFRYTRKGQYLILNQTKICPIPAEYQKTRCTWPNLLSSIPILACTRTAAQADSLSNPVLPFTKYRVAQSLMSQRRWGDIHLRRAHSEASLPKRFKVHGMKKGPILFLFLQFKSFRQTCFTV